MEQYNAAMLMIKPGNFDYIKSLINATRAYIRAVRQCLYIEKKRKNQKTKNDIKL